MYDEGASTSAEHHHPPVFPPSPKHQNSAYHSEVANTNEFGPIPISPHVNVPNTHAFNHHVPPPLPPRRREKKESDAALLAQTRQAPDAPELPPRDVSPPPVPPRLSLINTATKKSNAHNSFNEEVREHNLKLPHTSTIMMRRNSALSKDGNGVPSTSTVQTSTENNPIKKFRHNVTSAPPVSRPRYVIPWKIENL